jgi:hypothetical protein
MDPTECLLPSPEYGNRSRFRNVVFSSYLEFRTMDKVHKPTVTEGPNRAGVSVTSSEGENRFCLRNVEFSGYLEFRPMDKSLNSVILGQNPLDSTGNRSSYRKIRCSPFFFFFFYNTGRWTTQNPANSNRT